MKIHVNSDFLEFLPEKAANRAAPSRNDAGISGSLEGRPYIGLSSPEGRRVTRGAPNANIKDPVRRSRTITNINRNKNAVIAEKYKWAFIDDIASAGNKPKNMVLMGSLGFSFAAYCAWVRRDGKATFGTGILDRAMSLLQ
jgi:hypothetical protein